MKKGLTILIAALVICSAFTGMVTAEDYDIVSELSANGTGSFDRTLGVQTELGYAGKTLDEDFYTRWMGTDGDSKLQFDSTLEIFMGNSPEFEDKKISTIDYAQTVYSTNAKWEVHSKNYDIGASQCASTKGNMMESMEVGMDDTLNEFEFEGSVNGRARFTEKAVDPVSKVIYLDDDTSFDGRFDILKYSAIEKISYPEGEEDWLGCP